MEQDNLLDNLMQELRRGMIVLAVMSQLQEELYGYSILKKLSDRGLEVDQGTLYPLLRRLEGQGLLESKWRLEEARPRRYYVISEAGRKVLPLLRENWQQMVRTMDGLLESSDMQGEHDGTH